MRVYEDDNAVPWHFRGRRRGGMKETYAELELDATGRLAVDGDVKEGVAVDVSNGFTMRVKCEGMDWPCGMIDREVEVCVQFETPKPPPRSQPLSHGDGHPEASLESRDQG